LQEALDESVVGPVRDTMNTPGLAAPGAATSPAAGSLAPILTVGRITVMPATAVAPVLFVSFDSATS